MLNRPFAVADVAAEEREEIRRITREMRIIRFVERFEMRYMWVSIVLIVAAIVGEPTFITVIILPIIDSYIKTLGKPTQEPQKPLFDEKPDDPVTAL